MTSHNRPIARIFGIPARGDEGLRYLIANGEVTWVGGKPEFESPLELSPLGTPVSQMVLEDRG